jgi:hypothetical protein
MTNATRPTAAMIWKEGRETLKWAALVLLGTAIAVVLVLWNHRGTDLVERGYAHPGTPLLTEEFQAVTIVAGAAAALLIALAQTLPEKRLDKWAFLIHRPVTPSRLLIGKIMAGLGLYVLAVGLPYAAAVIWVATPGHVPAPFEPGMLLAGTADLLAGVMYYFAGMVIGLREARWYGSRVLALAPAIVGSFAVFLVHDFWQALLVIGLVTVVLATAAWANFVTGGNYDPQPRPSKVALGGSVFAVLVMLGGFGVALLTELLPRSQNVVEFSNYSMTASGKVVRFTQYPGNGGSMKVTDPNGQPLPEFEGVSDWQAYNEKLGRPLEVGLSINPQWATLSWVQSYRHAERYFHQVSPADTTIQPSRAYWYFVNGRGYVVGYDMRDRSVTGYFTPDGFHSQLQQASRRFDAERSPAALVMGSGTDLWLPSGVYRFRMTEPRVEVAFSTPPAEQLLAAGAAYAEADPNARTMQQPRLAFEAFATSSRVYVRPADARPMFSAPLEHSVKDYPTVSVSETRDGRYVLWYAPGYDSAAAWRRPHHLTELSAKGEVLGRYDLPGLGPPVSNSE